MVVEAPVLVEREHDHHAIPLRTRGERAVDLREEHLTLPDVAERVIVVGGARNLFVHRQVGVEPGHVG